MDKVSAGKRIVEALEKRNIKQYELADATGIPRPTLSQYISGKYEPKPNNVALMAKYLDVSDIWLMGYDVQMEREDWTNPSVEDFNSFLNEASEYYTKGNGIEDIKFIYQLILNNKGKIYLIEQLILLLNAPVFLEDYNLSDKFDAHSIKLHINKLIKAKDELAKEGGE